MIRRILVVALLPVVLLGFAQSQSSNDVKNRILTLENSWNQAEVKQDAQAISMLLADTFQYTDADGSTKNKKEWLAQVQSGSDHYEQLGNTNMVVQLYGSAAVVTGQYQERVRLHGKPITRSGRFTDTWIEQSGSWKCVASQSTLITP
jgi:hypothetical protein